MRLEQFWYEISPFLYTAMGGFFLGRAESMLLTICSVLLLLAGGTILFLRRRYSLQVRDDAKTRRAVRATPARANR